MRNEKLIPVTVELSKAQLACLNRLAYEMRSNPGDMLIALCFGAVEAVTDGMDTSEQVATFNEYLLKHTVERRAPRVVVGGMIGNPVAA